MTTFQDYVDSVWASGARGERIKQQKKVTRSGKLLSLLRSNGEWLAVVQAVKARQGDPVVSKIIPISQLKGPARRKADRWLGRLA